MKIAVEGMDGVGKSTVAKEIAVRKGIRLVEKPLHYFFDNNDANYTELMNMARKVYDIEDPIIRSWFFGLGNIACFRKLADEDFVVDRHFVSNYFWNGDEKSNVVFESMINAIGKPDLTIILYATPQTRMERLYKRNPNDKDLDDDEKKVDGYPKMLDFVNRFDIPYLLINTENKSIEEVVEEAIAEIDKIDIHNKTLTKKC